MYMIQFSLSTKSLLSLDFMDKKWNIQRTKISSCVSDNYYIIVIVQSYQNPKTQWLQTLSSYDKS